MDVFHCMDNSKYRFVGENISLVPAFYVSVSFRYPSVGLIFHQYICLGLSIKKNEVTVITSPIKDL